MNLISRPKITIKQANTWICRSRLTAVISKEVDRDFRWVPTEEIARTGEDGTGEDEDIRRAQVRFRGERRDFGEESRSRWRRGEGICGRFFFQTQTLI